jgi:hypothetical protein
MSDGMKSLDQVAREILENPHIHDLLTDVLAKRTLRDHPFKKLVEFQRDEYRKHGLDIRDQGFLPGIPWIGDIEKARVLFLSSNPAFTHDEKCLRYFAEKPGEFRTPDGTESSCWEEIQKSLSGYFQTIHVAGRALQFETLSGDHKAIPYWGCIRNNVEQLLPNAVKHRKPLEAYVRMLMSHAVCMEIVPFRSNRQIGVSEALSTCWEDFTRHILANAAAPIFVLVGEKVKDIFLKLALNDAERAKANVCFAQRGIYTIRGGSRAERSVVCVEFNNGKMRRFHTYFQDTKDTTLKTLTTLKEIMSRPL